MIWVVLYMLLFGGGGDASLARPFERVRPAVQKVVVEPARLAKTEAILTQVDEALAAHRAQREQAFAAWTELAKRRDVTKADLQARIRDCAAANAAFDARLVELRFALRDVLTRAEWQQVFPVPK
jgi:hypothetical protein